MDIVAIHPQLCILIAAAAAIAVMIEYLRRKNEELRMAMVELRSMREQEKMREHKKVVRQRLEPVSNPVVDERPPADCAAQTPGGVALSEWLSKRSGQKPAAIPEPAVSREPKEESAPATELQQLAAPQTAITADEWPTVFIDEALLESILGHGSPAKPSAPTPLRFEVLEASGSFPAGMQDEPALRRLLDANKPFSGLVVALSAAENDGRTPGQDVLLSVDHFVRGLLRETDFGCRTGPGEFVILSPAEDCGEAKRRMNAFSERLWDFQLRGMGNFSILFGWGDMLVAGEPIAEAVACARERMGQTRRARKTVSFDTATPRVKTAV